MRSLFTTITCSLACLLATDGRSAEPASPNLHALMKNVVAPQTQVIWDISNQAQDAQGNPDATKIKPNDWLRLTRASQQVMQATLALANVERVRAAAVGEKLQSEGNPGAFGAQEVQAVIDANPAAFRAFAQALAASMKPVNAASRARDAAKLFAAVGPIDQICEDCHVRFWYPNQKDQ